MAYGSLAGGTVEKRCLIVHKAISNSSEAFASGASCLPPLSPQNIDGHLLHLMEFIWLNISSK